MYRKKASRFVSRLISHVSPSILLTIPSKAIQAFQTFKFAHNPSFKQRAFKSKQDPISSATMSDCKGESSCSHGSAYGEVQRRMRLRDASQRRLPGRYREDEVPELSRPSWVHPDPVFNPMLASFVSPSTLPLDHPGPSPSRTQYHKWLASQGLTEEQHIQMIQNGEGSSKNMSPTTSLPSPMVSKGSSKGPAIVHLPPQVPGQSAIDNEEVDGGEVSIPDDETVSDYQMLMNGHDSDKSTMVSLSSNSSPFSPKLPSSLSPIHLIEG